MLRLSRLLVILLAAPLAAAAPPGDSAPETTAAYELLLGKLLAAENRAAEGVTALWRAVELAPEDPYLRAELAELLRRLGQLEEAERQVRRALELAPDNADLLPLAGEIYVSIGERDPATLAQAERVFRRLVAARPGDLHGLHMLGRILQRQGDLAGAEEMFRALLVLRPDLRTGASALLQVLLEQHKLEAASELLRATLERNPGDLEARFTLSDLLSEQGDHAGAVAVLGAAPEAAQDHPELRRRLAMELYRSGEGAAAVALMDELVASHPAPRLLLLRALLIAQQGDLARAHGELVELIAVAPTDAEVALALADVQVRSGEIGAGRATVAGFAAELRRLGERQKAEEAELELAQLLAGVRQWNAALEEAGRLREAASPGVRVAAALLRAEALLELERPREALVELQGEMAHGGPAVAAKRAEVLFRLGRERQADRLLRGLSRDSRERRRVVEVLQRTERYHKSIPLLEELLAESPAAVDLRFWLGSAYERTGRYAEAEAELRQVLAMRPDFHLALNYLGYMWADLGENLDEALELILRAVELEPDNGAYADSLGWVYYRLGRWPEALEQLQRASRLVPGDAVVLEHLGDVLQALGQLTEAKEAYRRALRREDASQGLRGKVEALERRLQRGAGK
jgi:tetratricopeptide (TPR) repeat protein